MAVGGALTAAGYQAGRGLTRWRWPATGTATTSRARNRMPPDAKLLADLVRTDRHNHRPVAGDSADAEAIKVLARAHQSLIWARTRHTNALRNAPCASTTPPRLEAFDDLVPRRRPRECSIAPRPPTRAPACP